MKKNIVRGIIYILLTFSIFGAGGGKGTLYVKTQIIPVPTTKKYSNGKSLILDAGVLNSNSNIEELQLASVSVRMDTIKNNNGSNANGIDGEFNQSFKLKELKNTLEGMTISLGNPIKYKGGDGTNLELYARNFRDIVADVRQEDPSDPKYVFVAYPEEATVKNQVISLSYKFDLYLKATGFNKGDIVRQDVTTGKSNNGDLEAVGSIRDIIKDQFSKLY